MNPLDYLFPTQDPCVLGAYIAAVILVGLCLALTE